ncbi:DUF2304 domain-containing protein [Oerskovia turbata]
MSGYPFALISCAILVLSLLVLLRRRRLREKYVAIWLVLAAGVSVLGAFPEIVASLATLVGVETPSNLLFALALMVLLIVCVQLSAEITSLEEESRTLVEEVAMLRHDLDELRGASAAWAEPQETDVVH